MTNEQAKRVAQRLLEIHERGGDAAEAALTLYKRCLRLIKREVEDDIDAAATEAVEIVQDSTKKVAKEVLKLSRKIPAVNKQVEKHIRKELEKKYDTLKKFYNVPDRLR